MSEIAETILCQMGGRAKLTLFTGCKIQTFDKAVEITVPRQAKGHCRRVRIEYNYGSDLYDVSGYSEQGTQNELHSEIYAEDLVELFEKMTGYFLGNIYVVGI